MSEIKIKRIVSWRLRQLTSKRNGVYSVLYLRPKHSATGWSIFGTKEHILITESEFSSNFDEFLQPKPPIL